MENNIKLPVDQQRLREFTRTLQKYKEGKLSVERRCIAAENWWKLRNSAEEAKEAQGLSGFKAVSGWLHNVLVTKHADGMEAYPEPLILPREPGDRAEARMLGKILPVVLEQNGFEQVYSDVLWQKLKTGTGVFKVVWDKDKLGGMGDISIQRVDLLNIFWEPGISDIQKSAFVFCTSLEDTKALRSRYPGLTISGADSFSTARFSYDDAVSTEGKTLVIEVYYKLWQNGRQRLHYCRYAGDTLLFSTENQAALAQHMIKNLAAAGTEKIDKSDKSAAAFASADAAAIAAADTHAGSAGSFVKAEAAGKSGTMAGSKGKLPAAAVSAATKAKSVTGSKAEADACGGDAEAHNEIHKNRYPEAAVKRLFPFAEGIYEHGLYPFVFDCLFPVEGSPCGYGFIDLCRNPQTQIDLLQTAFIKNTMVGALPRYFRRIDGAVNDGEFLDLDKALVTVNGNLGEDALRCIDYRPLSGNYLDVRRNIIDELRETSGNTESATGAVPGGVTAASAIAALQEASGKGSRDAARTSYRAYAKVIELCIELVRQFYALPRQFRITGQLGQEDFVSYTNAALRPRSMGSIGGVELGLYQPVFDVKVQAQKSSPYNRLNQNELALQFYRLGFFEPGRSEAAMRCLDMMDFEGRDSLMQSLSAAAQLQQRLRMLENYALEMTRKYRPRQAAELMLSLGMQPDKADILAAQIAADGGGSASGKSSADGGAAGGAGRVGGAVGVAGAEDAGSSAARIKAASAAQPGGEAL